MAIDERTLQMEEEYIKLFETGHTVKEIAELYGISEVTVYGRLNAIAEKSDKYQSRKDLLHHPHKKHAEPEKRKATVNDCGNLEQFDKLIQIMANNFSVFDKLEGIAENAFKELDTKIEKLTNEEGN